jgi:hypothetical protein
MSKTHTHFHPNITNAHIYIKYLNLHLNSKTKILHIILLEDSFESTLKNIILFHHSYSIPYLTIRSLFIYLVHP